LYFKIFIEGDIHLNEAGNRMIENSFLKEYNNYAIILSINVLFIFLEQIN